MKLVCGLLSFALSLLASDAAKAIDKPAPVIVYPAKAAGPVPVAVWLHGFRAFPSVMSDTAYFQRVADRLGFAIIGIPGTTLLDDGTPIWAEEPAADHAYIQDVLRRLAEKAHLDLQRVALFGFSQGAMVAADIAARYPAAYRGAIVMSPGGVTSPKAEAPTPDLNKTQTFFFLCGEKEAESNVQLTRAYAAFFRKLHAKVLLKEEAGQTRHARPSEFEASFPGWLTAILEPPRQKGG
jgi:predicted esterase